MKKGVLLFVFSCLSLGYFSQTPSGTIIPTSNFYCTGSTVTFSSVTNLASPSYTWIVVPFNGLSSKSNVNSSTISLTFSLSLTCTIYLNVGDGLTANTCSTTVTIYKTPKANFNASLSDAGFPNTLILTNFSTNNLSNIWEYSDVGTKDKSFNTSKSYNAPGTYTVILVSQGNKNCADTAGYSFEIPNNSELTLPNIFTPNEDGVNDVYKPTTKGIAYLKAYVYGRHQVPIATWEKVEGVWDGRTTSGEMCSDGVYFIFVHAIGFDGKDYKLKSPITLVR